jgi:hypothetical protein
MVFAALPFPVKADPIGFFGKGLVGLLVVVFYRKATLDAWVA